MPVVRFEPGTEAPRAGTYALTSEWGEPAGESARISLGERLPPVDTSVEPRWYVLSALESDCGQSMVGVPARPGEELRLRRAGGHDTPTPTPAPGATRLLT